MREFGSQTFLAIDFETADSGPDSACQIGCVRVEGGRVVEKRSLLIRPPRENIVFSFIHGITWEQVADAPDWSSAWDEVRDLFEGVDFLAAHNASFDRRVLQACCAAHGIDAPGTPFVCTIDVARSVFGIFPTRLSHVCKHLEIPLNHHEALSDASACAEILIRASRAADEVFEPFTACSDCKPTERRPARSARY